MTSPRDMAELRRVTATALAAAEARMAGLRAEEDRIRAQIDGLDAALRDRAATATAEDAALRAGADMRWQQWVDGRRRSLLSEQARLRARIEAERTALMRDFGRDAVTGDLTRRITDAWQRQRESRAERGW